MTFKNNANPGKWRSGWPPFTHWWNMSTHRGLDIWRWVDVDREFISKPCNLEIGDAVNVAKQQAQSPIEGFEYTDYWPKNARVGRVAPKGK